MTYEEAVVRSAVSIIVKHWEQGFRTVYGEMCTTYKITPLNGTFDDDF